jgi:hypothetical protein
LGESGPIFEPLTPALAENMHMARRQSKTAIGKEKSPGATRYDFSSTLIT